MLQEVEKMTYNEAVEDFILYISSYCSPATLEYYRVNLDFFSNYLFSKYGNLDFDVSLLSRIDYISYISYQRNRKVKILLYVRMLVLLRLFKLFVQ